MAPINALALATVWPLSKQPVHDEGVEDEDDADERLPQPHGRVLVVMAAAAFGIVIMMVMSGLRWLKREVTCISFTNLALRAGRFIGLSGLVRFAV